VVDNILEGNNLDKAAGDMFALFWRAMALPAEKALSCFQK